MCENEREKGRKEKKIVGNWVSNSSHWHQNTTCEALGEDKSKFFHAPRSNIIRGGTEPNYKDLSY